MKIHWTPEGDDYQNGFNFYICRSYFRVIFKSIDIKYFRFRWLPWPKIFLSQRSIITNHQWELALLPKGE